MFRNRPISLFKYEIFANLRLKPYLVSYNTYKSNLVIYTYFIYLQVTIPPLYIFIRNLLYNPEYNPSVVAWVSGEEGSFRVTK